MIHLLYSIDVAVFLFINRTLSNPVGDMLWPAITHYDQYLAVRILLLGIWLMLMIRGGARGRTAAILCILVLIVSDQFSSTIIKTLVARPRPCHLVNGVPVVPGVRLLVECGSGKSFPSSHAVNNFAMAALFAYYYRKWAWAFFTWASLVALSRPAVGVHYPSDILGGAVIGTLVALALLWLWTAVQVRYFPSLAPAPPGNGGSPPRRGLKL